MKRLMIYHHYDVDDMIDDHIVYQLKAYHDFGINILFVSNSALPSSEMAKISHLVDEWSLRKNESFDFGGWKELLLAKGPQFFSGVEELILVNCTCYGPFIPVGEFFEKMDRQSCDYWIFTKHSTSRGFPEHGQPYFIVLKKTILSAPAFWAFWEELPPLASMEDAIWLGEVRFLRTLEAAGFKEAVYYDSGKDVPDYEMGHMEPYCMNSADILLLKARVPLIKVKAVTEWFSRSCSIAPMIFQALNVLKSAYPQHLITNHIRRTQSLSCQRFLPGSVFVCPDGIPADQGPARIGYLTSVEEIHAGLSQAAPGGFPRLSAFGAKLEHYDYVVIVTTNGSKLRSDALTSRWGLMRTQASLSLATMVKHAVTCFEQEEHLGVLLPCLPSLCAVSNDFPKCLYLNGVKFLQACGIRFPRESRVPVLIPPPGYCIVRASLLKRLANCVAGQAPSDVTEEQILEMLPYIAQSFGYYFKQVTTSGDVLASARLYEDYVCSVQFNDDLLYYRDISFRKLLSVMIKGSRLFLVFRFPKLTRWVTRVRCLRKGIPWVRE